MEFIYILKCQKDKYYIGKSFNIQSDYNKHLDGNFCDITKTYKPFAIDAIFEHKDNIIYEHIIAKYIKKYKSINIYYENGDNDIIKKNKKGDKCICNNMHWLTDCELNIKDEYQKNILSCIIDDLTTKFRKNGICYRCGRFGHDANICTAVLHIEGIELSSDGDSENEESCFI